MTERTMTASRDETSVPGWRLPIAAYLAAGFGGLIALAVGTVLWLSLGTARQNTYDLLRTTAEFATGALRQGMAAELQPAREAVEYVAGRLSDGSVAIGDDRVLRQFLLGSLAGLPQIAGIAFVRDDLHAVVAGSGTDTEGQGPDASSGSWLDRPEIRLALRQARIDDEFRWGDVLYLRSLDRPELVLRKAVRQDGVFRGMVVAAVSLGELSHLLLDSMVQNAGRPFILRGRDQVLAYPGMFDRQPGLSPAKPLPSLGEIGDPVLAAIWSPSATDGRAILGSSGLTARSVDVDGSRYIFIYREIADYGQPWLVGYYVAAAEIDEPIRRLRAAAYAGGGILLLSILLALLIGRALGRAISQLSGAAAAIGRLEIDQAKPLRGSRFREVDIVARGYNAMLAGLRWFQTYVPKSLVLLLIGRGGDGGLASEQRDITVLFTDVVGFTAMGAHLPAPALADFLNRHFTLLGGCIGAEGGTIDKYIGDSVMAFWGAPEDQADHAAHACRAALAIRAALAADNRARTAAGQVPVRLRIGIHSGPAIVGNIGAPGRINYTVIGDTVNVAQRLEQLGKQFDSGAGDATVLLSATTAEALPADVAVERLGGHGLRGRDEKIEVFRLA
jgi:adenylate cyclase